MVAFLAVVFFAGAFAVVLAVPLRAARFFAGCRAGLAASSGYRNRPVKLSGW